jgi:hypothetical protein
MKDTICIFSNSICSIPSSFLEGTGSDMPETMADQTRGHADAHPPARADAQHAMTIERLFDFQK